MNIHYYYYNKKIIIIICVSSSILIYKIFKRKRKRKNIKINAISFGPTGANFSYQLGISKYIQNNFNLNNFKFAAVSGGTHSAMCLGLNIDVDKFFYKFTMNTFNKNSEFNEIFEIARKSARDKLLTDKYLDNINDILNNKVYIGLTKIYPYLHSESINVYSNFDDMFDCVLASQCIPYITCKLPYFTFRNEIYIDGFLSNMNFMPVKANWYYINIFDFKDKVSYYEYLFSGIYNLKNLCNQDFHYNQYIQGFNDAKKRHKHFLDVGFIEK